MSETFYTILGINEKATKDEIKKSYRALSLKHHPDRNNNSAESNDLFKKIGEAYETLSDETKRAEYDARNSNPFFRINSHNGGGGGMEFPIEEIFKSFFGGMPGGMMGGMPGGMPGGMMHGIPGANIHVFTSHGGGGFAESLQKPTPIIKTMEVNMEQVLNGATLPLDIEKWILENGVKVFEKETLYVNIPKGIDDNEIIILRERGNVLNERIKGDIKLFIKVINSSTFERKGLDLIMQKNISLKEALCGFNFEFEYINGKIYTLNNNSGNIIPPNYNKILTGMGLTRESNTGNLIVQFFINFPEKLSDEKIQKISEIL